MISMAAVVPFCVHNKAYSGDVVLVFHGQGEDRWLWVCRNCNETGSDTLDKPPKADPEFYWSRWKLLFPDSWIPAKYR